MTFSLVGRCARTGMLGAVVTTSSISVGSRCSHARAGIGAALTQHRTDPRLGPLALDLLAHGFSEPEAMQAVVAATPHRHWRQLALIDAAGRTAVYSGANVRAERGEAQGKDCAAIANIVRSASLPQAMVAAYCRRSVSVSIGFTLWAYLSRPGACPQPPPALSSSRRAAMASFRSESRQKYRPKYRS